VYAIIICTQPNMILPGLDAPVPPPEVVAKYTVQVSYNHHIRITSEQHHFVLTKQLCKLAQRTSLESST
jgi:hypothetical protein